MEKGDLLDGLLHLLRGEASREPVCGGEPLALQLAHQLLLRFDLITRKHILKGEYIRFLQIVGLVHHADYSDRTQMFPDSTTTEYNCVLCINHHTYSYTYVLQNWTIAWDVHHKSYKRLSSEISTTMKSIMRDYIAKVFLG